MTNHSTAGIGWLSNTVTKNPEGLLLLAAGMALLLRSGRSARRNDHQNRARSSSPYDQWDRDARRPSDFQSNEKEEGMVTKTAQAVSEYVSEMSESVSETASNYASAATEYADSARRTVVDRSGKFAEDAQSTLRTAVDRVLQDQPLAIALAGLATGALVAAAFPATRIERDTLGPAGEWLSDAASSAGEKLSQASSAAGDELVKAAEEKGLNSEGLKDVAREVSEAFGSELSGEQTKAASAAAGKAMPSSEEESQRASNGATRVNPATSQPNKEPKLA